MSLPLTLVVAAIEKIPLVYTDDAGVVVAPVTGGAVTSSDETILIVVLDESGSFVTVTAVAAGTGSVGYSNGPLSATLAVSVTPPVATHVDFDVPAATPVTA